MALERENQRNASHHPQQPQSPTQSSASSFMTTSTIPTSVASYPYSSTHGGSGKILTGAGPNATASRRRPLSQRYPTQPYNRSAASQSESDSQSITSPPDSPPQRRSSRPAPERFDSLQELLEQAGYKDTRVITPQTKSLAARIEAATRRSPSQDRGRDRTVTPATPTRLAGDQTPSSRHAQLPGHTSQAQDDPTPTKSAPSTSLQETSSNAAGSGWFGSIWWRGLNTSRSPSPSPSPASRESQEQRPSSPTESIVIHQTSPAKESPRRIPSNGAPPLRNVRSATHLPLWKGSRSHAITGKAHTQIAARCLTNDAARPASPPKDWQHRSGRNDALYNVGLTKADGEPKPEQSAAGGSNPIRPRSSSASIEEWRRSLVDVKGPQQPAIAIEDVDADDPNSPPKFRLRAEAHTVKSSANSSDLFGSLATPIVTSDPAVAPRNAECFAGPEARGLRHAKSVEALRGALKTKKKAPVLKERHSIIGQFVWGSSPAGEEIPPVPPLPSLPSDPSIVSVGIGRTVYQDSQSPEAEAVQSPERPTGPPVLTLTSPSGVHSPQFIRLDSREFSLSFSPEQQRRIMSKAEAEESYGSISQMLITEESLPDQLRNIGSFDEAGDQAHPGDDHTGAEERRRFAMGPRRFDPHDAFSDGESSAGSWSGSDRPSQDGEEVPRRRKSRRGCRAGKNHNRAAKRARSLEQMKAAGEVQSDLPSSPKEVAPKPLRRHNSSRSMRTKSKQNRPSTADGVLQHSGSAVNGGMLSFGAALQGLKEGNVDDDPFIAHVTQAEELKRQRSKSADVLYSRNKVDTVITTSSSSGGIDKPASRHHGLASILLEGSSEEVVALEAGSSSTEGENDENAAPSAVGDVPKLRTRGSNSALKGRIVGRRRPVSPASSSSAPVSETLFGAGVSRGMGSSAVNLDGPVTMSSASSLDKIGPTDSPTRPVARRLRSTRSRSRVAL